MSLCFCNSISVVSKACFLSFRRLFVSSSSPSRRLIDDSRLVLSDFCFIISFSRIHNLASVLTRTDSLRFSFCSDCRNDALVSSKEILELFNSHSSWLTIPSSLFSAEAASLALSSNPSFTCISLSSFSFNKFLVLSKSP